MDGGGRLLRSLTEAGSALVGSSRLRFAGVPGGFEPSRGSQDYAPPRSTPYPPRGRSKRRTSDPMLLLTRRGGVGVALSLVLFAATGLFGAVRGGQYAAYVEANGSPFDLVAKVAGFPINAITISGLKELDQHEILKAAAVDPKNSLLFLDAASVRDRLKALPLIKDAVITKLFPDRLMIAVDERDPVALWQKDGQLSIVSNDGTVIDGVHDDRFIGLPFVVGQGANAKVGQFLALLDAAGDLRGRIAAGILVGDRRWTLRMDNGVEVALPETGGAEQVARLVALDGQSKLLDKDVVSVDLRRPTRVTVRLSADAAAARAEALAKKPKSKGPHE